ncbi:hypothetical protein SAMN05519103_08729 [Rhizobiales bacterium GAS113]|nr:hypothetical protein SAMN05519103_08729 [Rhizobiales bacterium GAS113]
MDKDTVLKRLRGAGFIVQKESRMGDDDGWRLTLANGAVVHCFDTGRRIVHGPDRLAIRSALGLENSSSTQLQQASGLPP